VSPTVLRKGPYRFYFFSREEDRMHVHVECADGEAKFWLEPVVEEAQTSNLKRGQIREIQKLIAENEHEIRDAWTRHFER
jgi:hypothetical protein